MAKVEDNLKNHKNLLAKKQALVVKLSEQAAKEKELEDSKEVKDKKTAVNEALEEVKKAEALVKEGMDKGKTAVNDTQMKTET